jgi:4,5:9,10-diseco-3-hydroxy-5,9,17-trioxoandrosta-1(10),2-diene-4-oate hydrolase
VINNAGIENRWINIKGINIHYKVAGEGSPIILLHGGSNDSSDWQHNVSSLAESYRVYAPDLIGYGLSDKPDVKYSIDYYIDFLDNFMQEMEIEKASLIGHSLGGGIALGYILRFPQKVEKIVLVDSFGLSDGYNFLCKFVGTLFMIRDFVLRKKPLPSRQMADVSSEGNDRAVFLHNLHEIESPALIVWGSRDFYFPVTQAYAAHELLKDSRLHVFKECGHSPQKQRSKEFNQIILEFLS